MCDKNEPTKSIKQLDGYYFNIPDYQRGYRWGEENCRDLLDDIWLYMKNRKAKEIYCIQPLVVKRIPEDIKRVGENKYDVIDGQQRLTTIMILLGYLQSCPEIINIIDSENDKKAVRYYIKYDTRDEQFLNQLALGVKEPIDKENKAIDPEDNIDYYHMKLVRDEIENWFDKRQVDKGDYYNTLLEKVCFIWYPLGEYENATDVFSRLNEGKIPLTDAELIKALFLNQSNFGVNDSDLLNEKQLNIALEWDEIENTLQNDEFWFFINSGTYNKSTRIDFIFRIIEQYDYFKIKDYMKEKEIKLKKNHHALSYFQIAFKKAIDKTLTTDADGKENYEWLTSYWKLVKEVFCMFEEWYNDYKLFHYVGYLISVNENNIKKRNNKGGENPEDSYDEEEMAEGEVLDKLIKSWNDSRDKGAFIKRAEEMIIDNLAQKPWIYYKDENDNIYTWQNFVFSDAREENSEATIRSLSKTKVVDFLLLLNIETIIKRNDKLVEDKKKSFNLPDFNRFPFHLYKKDKWEVEHIYPQAGDKTDNYDSSMIYLWYIKENYENLLQADKNAIEEMLKTDKKQYGVIKEEMDDLITRINNRYLVEENEQKPIDDKDKNRIRNYTLLDKSTNASYLNWMYPVKRLHILKKEMGKLPKCIYNKQQKKWEIKSVKGVAYILPCTKNVFTKAYSDFVKDVFYWTEYDAEQYEKKIWELLYTKYIKPAEEKRRIGLEQKEKKNV